MLIRLGKLGSYFAKIMKLKAAFITIALCILFYFGVDSAGNMAPWATKCFQYIKPSELLNAEIIIALAILTELAMKAYLLGARDFAKIILKPIEEYIFGLISNLSLFAFITGIFAIRYDSPEASRLIILAIFLWCAAEIVRFDLNVVINGSLSFDNFLRKSPKI